MLNLDLLAVVTELQQPNAPSYRHFMLFSLMKSTTETSAIQMLY